MCVCLLITLIASVWDKRPLFERVKIIQFCMKNIINADMLKGPGNSPSYPPGSRRLCLFKFLHGITHNSPHSPLNYPSTSEKKLFHIWNARAAVSVWKSSGCTRNSTLGCDPRATHIFCFIVTFLLLRLMSLTLAALRLLNSLALLPLSSLQAINLQLKTAISLSTCRMRKLSSGRVVTCAFWGH